MNRHVLCGFLRNTQKVTTHQAELLFKCSPATCPGMKLIILKDDELDSGSLELDGDRKRAWISNSSMEQP